MNAMKSMEGHTVKYLHSDSKSWMSLLYGCKELLHNPMSPPLSPEEEVGSQYEESENSKEGS